MNNAYALLIGSATFDLKGPDHDVLLMENLLSEREFTIHKLTGEKATYNQIVLAFEKLASQIVPNDTVLFYYSGHGGLVENPKYRTETGIDPTEPAYYQYLVPTDYHLSTEENFRGLMDFELSEMLKLLTERTENVTIILDCCHSAGTMRDSRYQSRSLPSPWQLGLPVKIRRWQATGKQRGFASGNPHAVRLSAAGKHEYAYEYTNAENHSVGLMTESLFLALKDQEDVQLSWQTLLNWVRERVLQMNRYQNVELGGPIQRKLFQLEQVHDNQRFLLSIRASQPPFIQAGKLHGICPNDVFAVLPGLEGDYDESKTLMKVTVAETNTSFSLLKESLPDSLDQGGYSAFKIEQSQAPLPVNVAENAPASLISSIKNDIHLTMACENHAGEASAEIGIDKGNISLAWNNRQLFTTTAHYDRIPAMLRSISRANALNNLQSGLGSNSFDQETITLSWGIIENGTAVPKTHQGESLQVGDCLYIHLANHGYQSVFVNIFNVGIDYSIYQLTHEHRAGVEIKPLEEKYFGFDPQSLVCDWELTWPEMIEDDGDPWPDTFVIILSDRPQDLTSLETVEYRRCGGSNPSDLQKMINFICVGASRNVRGTKVADVKYAVNKIHFQLSK